MFPERIETERLVLEQMSHENVDIFELQHICSVDDGIEEVAQYLLWDPNPTVNEVREEVEQTEERWENGEAAGYIIRLASGENGDGEIAGSTGVKLDWERRTAEPYIWLRKRFWGRGYSKERAAALMDLTFNRLDLDLFAVTHHVENTNSQHAVEEYIQKYGGQRDGLLRNWRRYGDEIADEYRYTIAQEQYRDATQENYQSI
jgi:ribosomal-protein-alanine N-acetyltransferase